MHFGRSNNVFADYNCRNQPIYNIVQLGKIVLNYQGTVFDYMLTSNSEQFWTPWGAEVIHSFFFFTISQQIFIKNMYSTLKNG